MRTVAAAVVAGMLAAGPAAAQQPQATFPSYIEKADPVNPPYLPTDIVPLVRDGKTLGLPADTILTPSGAQTITGKEIDCTVNACLNFPGESGPLPTTCGGSGAVDGAAYNNSGVVAICSTTALTMGGVPLTMGGVPITGL